jgi:uncharacterized protein YhbP (UPF0306 family)
MNDLQIFLQSQKLLTLATSAEDPWVSTMYYGADDLGALYFISSTKAEHSEHIIQNPSVAFSVAWFNPANHADRKAVQGRGMCTIANIDEQIATGVRLHNANFPEFSNRITVEYVKDTTNPAAVWLIEPVYIKFWNDELYGLNGTKEFDL